MNTIWIISMALQWVVIAVLGVLVLSLVRQLGVLSIRLNPSAGFALANGPGPGSEIPPQEVALFPDGQVLAGGARGRPLLIATLSPDCSMCTSIASSLRVLDRDYTDTDVLVAIKGTPRLVREFVESHSLQDMDVALTQYVPKDLTSNDTPSAVMLTKDGTLAARGVPNALEHLEEMVKAGHEGMTMNESDQPTSYAWGESLPVDGNGQAEIHNVDPTTPETTQVGGTV